MPKVSQVFDSETNGVIMLSSDFKLLSGMDSAVQLLQSFFDFTRQNNEIPERLRTWLKGIYKPTSEQKTVTAGSFKRYSRKLLVIAFKEISSGNITLVLKEDPLCKEQYLEVTQLMSKRQKEIYHFLCDREKSIHEIAEALGISHRTAEEHRRQVNRILKEKELKKNESISKMQPAER